MRTTIILLRFLNCRLYIYNETVKLFWRNQWIWIKLRKYASAAHARPILIAVKNSHFVFGNPVKASAYYPKSDAYARVARYNRSLVFRKFTIAQGAAKKFWQL
jgi:hypothetical protein